jgi:hypothetical protein
MSRLECAQSCPSTVVSKDLMAFHGFVTGIGDDPYSGEQERILSHGLPFVKEARPRRAIRPSTTRTYSVIIRSIVPPSR